MSNKEIKRHWSLTTLISLICPPFQENVTTPEDDMAISLSEESVKEDDDGDGEEEGIHEDSSPVSLIN